MQKLYQPRDVGTLGHITIALCRLMERVPELAGYVVSGDGHHLQARSWDGAKLGDVLVIVWNGKAHARLV